MIRKCSGVEKELQLTNRYMSADAFRVLTSIEMGMKNHDCGPVPLIVSLSNLRHGGVHKILSDLLRDKLVAHERVVYGSESVG